MRKLIIIVILIPFIGFGQKDVVAKDRKGVIFQLVNQTDVEFTPTTGKCGYEITIKDQDGNSIENVKVAMVDLKSKTKFLAYTDRDGVAKFWVNSGARYEVDIEKKEAVDIIEIERIKYGVRKGEYTYSN
jgi:hypothetical protein